MPTKLKKTKDYEPTGYETYTQEERAEMAKRIEFDLRQERHCADGGGLRAEIARANVRHFTKQIEQLKKTRSL